MREFLNLLPGRVHGFSGGLSLAGPGGVALPAGPANSSSAWQPAPAPNPQPISAPRISAPPGQPAWSAPVSSAGLYDFAGYGPRVVALFVDGAIVSVVIVLVVSLLAAMLDEAGALLGSLLAIFYSVWYYVHGHSTTGQTIGKRMMHIKVVGTDGLIISRSRAFGRFMVLGVESAGTYLLVGAVGLLWPLWDKNKQAWHDKAVNTYVVRA
jgi:uncharacterized RDD family membrane protein YckC